jgi:hypothetical protein
MMTRQRRELRPVPQIGNGSEVLARVCFYLHTSPKLELGPGNLLTNRLTVAWRRCLPPSRCFTSTGSCGRHHFVSFVRELSRAAQDVGQPFELCKAAASAFVVRAPAPLVMHSSQDSYA